MEYILFKEIAIWGLSFVNGVILYNSSSVFPVKEVTSLGEIDI